MIRKAEPSDIDFVSEIYSHIHDAEETGKSTVGWLRAVYPIRQTAADAVARGDLFVMEEEGTIVAAGIINQLQPPAYQDCTWEYPAEPSSVLVLHTLVVDPAQSGHGYGTAFVNFYEQYAAACGCPFLRLDTNERNSRARALYAGLGYREIAVVPCLFNGIPGVNLVCLEKKLEV